jgi:excisionase family DNA binding protein
MPVTKLEPAPVVPNGAQLTIKDVAIRLNVDHQTVRQLIKTGAIRYLRVGRVYRFREAWVDAFIDSAVEAFVDHARK